MYRQYTDDSYSKEIPKPEWLGFLGPILRAEVGDVMVVHMKNFASRPYSLHPHGVFYKKDSEGWRLQYIISLYQFPYLVFLHPFPSAYLAIFLCLSLSQDSNLESLDTHPINQ